MRKSICLIFIIIAISFSACVGGDDLDVPLSATEKTFYENLKDNGFSYDSIQRNIFRYKNLIWIKQRGKYSYSISFYNKSGIIDTVRLNKTTDTLKRFVSDYAKQKNMKLENFYIYYEAKNLSVDLSYQVNKKGEFVLINKQIW